MIVMAPPIESKPISATTARAVAFVAARREAAEELGAALAESINDPDAFAEELAAGMRSLSDPEYEAGSKRVAPGLGPVYGVRWPLLAAISRGFRNATRREPPTPMLFIADRLFHEKHLEPRWFAFGLLERTVLADPERSWQLMRRAAREAGDWITVDTLAHAYSKGIAAEPYRWSELEQLVYSPSRWERRLVGSTIATMTHGGARRRLGPDVVEHGLDLLSQLVGDAEPDVQKALSWAYRSLAGLDLLATSTALRTEADRAAAESDGHRAWVIRDSLPKLDPATADDLRERLSGIRRRPGAPATSDAAAVAAGFGPLPDPRELAEPPLTGGDRPSMTSTNGVSQEPKA
jgi:3-methyladenine DNA glycosylase AlkD